jgi:hypothetical protein
VSRGSRGSRVSRVSRVSPVEFCRVGVRRVCALESSLSRWGNSHSHSESESGLTQAIIDTCAAALHSETPLHPCNCCYCTLSPRRLSQQLLLNTPRLIAATSHRQYIVASLHCPFSSRPRLADQRPSQRRSSSYPQALPLAISSAPMSSVSLAAPSIPSFISRAFGFSFGPFSRRSLLGDGRGRRRGGSRSCSAAGGHSSKTRRARGTMRSTYVDLTLEYQPTINRSPKPALPRPLSFLRLPSPLRQFPSCARARGVGRRSGAIDLRPHQRNEGE